MNNLKEIEVDVIHKVSEISSENQIHVKRITTGGTEKIPQVSQGGINILTYPAYEGEYEATPTAEEQVFSTEGTSMLSDFTVHATPYSEVSNPEGGETVTIL